MLYPFFFNDTATTEIYTLSLHDALPIWTSSVRSASAGRSPRRFRRSSSALTRSGGFSVRNDSSRSRLSRSRLITSLGTSRSEEHTSELQSRQYLVCRLLLEKNKNKPISH